jgi:L-malate glycosyltransferase
MKILVFGSSAFPRWPKDPSPVFVYNLSEHLAKLNNNVSVLVPHHPGSKRSETIKGMRVHRFRYFLPSSLERLCYGGGILPNMKKSFLAKIQLPFLITAEFFALLSVARKEKPDVIHAHWILPQGFTAALVGKILNIPIVTTAHAGDVFPLKNPIFKILSKFSVKSAAASTVNSNFTNKAVEKISGIKSKVIPMGVDLKTFSSSSSTSQLKKKYRIGNNDKILLFVGRLAEKKGVTYLISAMNAIIKKYPNCKLLIVGDGPEKPALIKQTQSLGLFNKIIFTGSIPNSDLPQFYKAADIFVLPSIIDKRGDTEGLGVVLLEAIASGTAVIASNVGGIPDIVMNKKTGLLTDQKSSLGLSSAIVNLLGSLSQRKKLATAAKQHISKNYSWNKIAKEFNSVFSSILSK